MFKCTKGKKCPICRGKGYYNESDIDFLCSNSPEFVEENAIDKAKGVPLWLHLLRRFLSSEDFQLKNIEMLFEAKFYKVLSREDNLSHETALLEAQYGEGSWMILKASRYHCGRDVLYIKYSALKEPVPNIEDVLREFFEKNGNTSLIERVNLGLQ